MAAGEPSNEAFLPLHEERDAYKPTAVFGKKVYFIAWQSGRTAPGDLRKNVSFIGDIVGCRVDKSGKPLDAEPFVICGAKDLQEFPRAAFGGRNFLIVWQDLRNGKDWDVYAARVTPEGKVLDPDGILVSGGAHNQAKPRVTWDGKSFLIVWQDFRSGKWYEVHGARVSPEGGLLDAEGVKLASADFHHCYAPTVASAGDGRSFVLWVGSGWSGDGGRIPMATGLFVEDGKAKGDGAYINKSNKEHGPNEYAQPIAMASGKDSYLAAWKTDSPHGRGGAPDESNAAIFDFKGERKANLRLAGDKAGKVIVDTDVAWDGSSFVVVWHEFVRETKIAVPSDVVFAARVAPGGKLVTGAMRLSGELKSPASQACVASDGAGVSLFAYEKHPEKVDVPIKVGFRMLNAADSSTPD